MAQRQVQSELRALAAMGAKVRLVELQQEIRNIQHTFPELRGGRLATSTNGAASATPNVTRRRRRNGMSTAGRAEVSRRMKAYWAAKRKEKKS